MQARNNYLVHKIKSIRPNTLMGESRLGKFYKHTTLYRSRCCWGAVFFCKFLFADGLGNPHNVPANAFTAEP